MTRILAASQQRAPLPGRTHDAHPEDLDGHLRDGADQRQRNANEARPAQSGKQARGGTEGDSYRYSRQSTASLSSEPLSVVMNGLSLTARG